MSLQNGPREVVLAPAALAVARSIAGEVARDGEQVQIGLGLAMARPLDHGNQRAIAGIETVAVAPFGELAIHFAERRMLQALEIGFHLVNDADLITILQVPAHAGQIGFDLDLVPLEVTFRADARQST